MFEKIFVLTKTLKLRRRYIVQKNPEKYTFAILFFRFCRENRFGESK